MAERTTQQEQKGWRNRIVRMGVKPASEFVAHPMNWRIHPRAQQEALEGALDETGWRDYNRAWVSKSQIEIEQAYRQREAEKQDTTRE